MDTLILRARGATTAKLSTTALAAILTGVGVVILGLFICLIVLLVQAIRNHKRILADLEERGVVIAQSQRGVKRESISRPRAVLRRNTILPFNTKSGWGALPSVETVNALEPPSIPNQYAPLKPATFVSKSSRLSWPFTAHRGSGKNIHLRKIRVPILSTVIESPKPSPLVPVLNNCLDGELLSPGKSRSRPTSDQSLLQHHPAFRKTWQEGDSGNVTTASSEPLRRSLTAKPVTKTELRVRPNRSRSITEIPLSTASGTLSQLPRPKIHVRSASMCSQTSGNVPNAAVPPLPLEVARIKSESRRHSLLSRSPSRISVSSFESAGSSIIATQSSPILPRLTNVRVQKITTKCDWRNSMIVGPRPMRGALTLHGKNSRSQSSIKSSAARFSSVTPSSQGQSRTESRNSTLSNSSSMQSINVKTAESVTLSKVSSPVCSPLTIRSVATPRRRSGTYVTAYGSPEERQKGSYVPRSIGNHGGPQRQLSQASTQASSTRSSNGNPFQWDPTPLSSGKPSALKGSPSARKGHRRQNCVRISLAPTILGPPSRSPSPSFMHNIQEESPNTATTEKKNNVGLGFSITRSLPRPPSTSIFDPDIKIVATSIRASLTPSSPTLSMANYDHGPVGSPVLSFTTVPTLPQASGSGANRLSMGSTFSIPAFPSPCHGIGSVNSIALPPPTFALSRPSNEYDEGSRFPESPFGPSSPFDVIVPDDTNRPSLNDEYDPEQPYLVYQTSTNSPPTRNFSSPFSTIPEEPSPVSTRAEGFEQMRCADSPPCSPKSLPQKTLPTVTQNAAYNIPIKDTVIPEEDNIDAIDLAILGRDAFSVLNSGFNKRSSAIIGPSNNDHRRASLDSACSLFEPFLEATFPSSPPTATQVYTELLPSSPHLKRARSDTPSSLEPPSSPPYSLVNPLSSTLPQPPCSPRPRHATLPTPALNLASVPTLNPPTSNLRGKPLNPLHLSIQKLRHMNSDAEKGNRGEKRYLCLGQDDSTTPPDESWLDEMEKTDDETETENNEDWDEEKGRRLVGNLLEESDDDATILELGEYQTPTPTRGCTSIPSNADTVSGAVDDEKQCSSGGPPTPRHDEASSPSLAERSSSIWEDGEKFWASTPPHPPNSPNKPKQRFLPLSSSPVSVPGNRKKREFEVAKDEGKEREGGTDRDGVEDGRTKRKSGSRYRKRNVLGVATPNAGVRVQVCPPSGGGGTPGSLYDQEGFLR